MKPWTRTFTLVALAGLMVGAVYATRPAPREVALLSDQGQPLAPKLSDPLAVKALEVVSFDEQSSRMLAFSVKFESGRWVIPTHSNYPADATEKVAAAASAFAGLIKERVVTDDKREHEQFGVLLPDDKTLSGKGVGVRVTLRDAAAQPLADLIIGKPVKADSAPGTPAQRYVRDASSNRVYVTTFASGFSTRFTDWVQTDLLQVAGETITDIYVDRYKINPDARGVTEGTNLTLTRPPKADAAGLRPWLLTTTPGGALGPSEAVNTVRIEETLSRLTQLKISGVRPKPANLAKVLASPDKGFRLSLPDQLSLQARGFYLGQDGQLLASEGQMAIKTSEGLQYLLWFGEAVPETEDAASGTVGENKSATPPPAGGPSTLSRYVMITAAFDPKAVPEPAKPADLIELEKQAEAASKEQPATSSAPATTPGATPAPADGASAASATPPETAPQPPAAPKVDAKALEEKRAIYQGQVDQWKASTDAARKRAEAAAKRFSEWYYVIDTPSLDKIRPAREDLVQPAPPPATPATPAGATTPPGVGAPGAPAPVPFVQPK